MSDARQFISGVNLKDTHIDNYNSVVRFITHDKMKISRSRIYNVSVAHENHLNKYPLVNEFTIRLVADKDKFYRSSYDITYTPELSELVVVTNNLKLSYDKDEYVLVHSNRTELDSRFIKSEILDWITEVIFYVESGDSDSVSNDSVLVDLSDKSTHKSLLKLLMCNRINKFLDLGISNNDTIEQLRERFTINIKDLSRKYNFKAQLDVFKLLFEVTDNESADNNTKEFELNVAYFNSVYTYSHYVALKRVSYNELLILDSSDCQGRSIFSHAHKLIDNIIEGEFE